MKTLTRKLFAVLCAVFLLAGLIADAALADESPAPEEPVVLSCTEVPLFADGEFVGNGFLMDTITYVPLRTFVETVLQTECDVLWDQETRTASLTTDELSITVGQDDGFMVVNGRYLYLQDRIYNINGTIIVPIRELAKVFGLAVSWCPNEWTIDIDTTGLQLPQSGETFYSEEDLYWLSRVIYSESGNQPLEGMIGVGNVVMNRVNDESGVFGKGIYGVIFYPGQFDVVAGLIYSEPSELAVVAAKLVLEGYNTVGDAKWFVNPAIGSTRWFRTYKTYRLTIADHDFYA